MSFDDKKFGTLFPTRTGTPTGTANERQMLEAGNGSAGFRKRFKTNSDGSVTMLQTRNGFPEFTTTPVKKDSPGWSLTERSYAERVLFSERYTVVGCGRRGLLHQPLATLIMLDDFGAVVEIYLKEPA